jgi:hypothetical protein
MKFATYNLSVIRKCFFLGPSYLIDTPANAALVAHLLVMQIEVIKSFRVVRHLFTITSERFIINEEFHTRT